MAGLTGQYIQVKRKRNGEVTYGGDQGFFAGAPAGSADERKRRLGCGIVALGDILLYLANTDPAYRTKENESYVNRILSEEEYKTYYNLIYDFIGGISPGARDGLSGIRIQRKFNKMARRQRWKLRARWGLSSGKLYGRITEMLSRNIPVILCIPVMLLKKDKGQGLTFYKRERGAYGSACTVSAHYVTITGVITENDGIYLAISSWGVQYYIKWNEYEQFIHTHFLGTILGNILYIR